MSSLATADLQIGQSTESSNLRWELYQRDSERDSALADWVAGQLETDDDTPLAASE